MFIPLADKLVQKKILQNCLWSEYEEHYQQTIIMNCQSQTIKTVENVSAGVQEWLFICAITLYSSLKIIACVMP